MDRNRKIVVFVFLMLLQSIVASSVIAAPSSNDQPQANAPVAEQTNKASATKSTPRFPYLQRALIIATIVNFVIIIFALSMYIVKRRMNQFSPVPRPMGHHES